MKKILPLLLFISCLWMTIPASAQEVDATDLITELKTLKLERARLVKKIQANVAQKQKIEQQYQQWEADPEKKRLDDEFASIEAQRPSVEAQCTDGTYPTQEEANAATARCDSVRNPFNNRVAVRNADADRYNAIGASIDQQEAERLAAAENLIQASEKIERRIAEIEKHIPPLKTRTSKLQACMQRCMSSSESDQCLSACFDGSRPLPPGTVEVGGSQFFINPDNPPPVRPRTFEEADQENRKYPNPGPSSLKTRAPPPPSR